MMKSTQLDISVIIPTRNGAARLERCLEALKLALGPNDEIIVVNDASTDNTESVITHFPCRAVNLKENIGAARARNRGAREASKPILFFTDDDVLVKPDTLTQLRANFSDQKVSGVVGILDSEIPFTDLASNIKNLWMRFTYLECPKEKVGLFYTSVASIRREVFLEVGGFDEKYSGASLLEDTEFGQRVWQRRYDIRIDPRISVIHVKYYTWKSILKTDYDRARALTHMKLRKWGQQFYTSVPWTFQLAVPVLLLAVLLMGSSFVLNLSLVWSLLFFFLFFGLTSSWVTFLFRVRGFRFGLVATLFHPIDSLAVGCGMVSACIRHLLGKVY